MTAKEPGQAAFRYLPLSIYTTTRAGISYRTAHAELLFLPDGANVMIISHLRKFSPLIVVPLATGLIVAPASETQAQRAGEIIGAGAAGVALGLLLGGISQQQAQPQAQPREQAPRRTYRRDTSSNDGTRSVGNTPSMSKSEIEKIQEALNLLGYDAGTVDGSLGQQTVRAINKFQSDNKFPQTGRLSPEGQKVLFTEVDKKKSPPPDTPGWTGTPPIAPPPTRGAEVAPDPKLEITLWESVRSSTVAEEIEDYISRYPNGNFRKVAELRLEQIKSAKPVTPGSVTPPASNPDGTQASLPPIDDSAFPKAKQRRADAVAVIIGNSAYANDVPKVDFSLRDAEAIKLLAMKTLGVDSQNVILLKDATRAKMESVFGTERDHKGQLWRQIDPDGGSDVFIFYSGHGVPSIEEKSGPQLLPVDADPKLQSYNGYPLDLLYKNLGDLKSKSTTVFLDACFSGQAGDNNKTSLIKNASPVFISSPTPAASTKINVFAAAGDRQLSSWDTNAGYGIFTRYVLSGLAGEAVDGKKKEVTAKDLQDYVNKNVRKAARRLHGREQDPTFVGDGDFVISSFN